MGVGLLLGLSLLLMLWMMMRRRRRLWRRHPHQTLSVPVRPSRPPTTVVVVVVVAVVDSVAAARVPIPTIVMDNTHLDLIIGYIVTLGIRDDELFHEYFQWTDTTSTTTIATTATY